MRAAQDLCSADAVNLSVPYERSLGLLEPAVEQGFGNIDWLLNDNDLVPLHGGPGFRRLVEQLEALNSEGR